MKLCVIGDPVKHSLSPVIHNAALRHLGLDCSYEKVLVRREELGRFMDRARTGEYSGVSVTMPHKIAVCGYLDRLSEDAGIVGAVNTVVWENGTLAGHNTDGEGCVSSLGANGVSIAGRTVVVLGAGGTASAVVLALARRGAARVIIHNRSHQRGEELAKRFADEFGELVRAVALGELADAVSSAEILVNATPVGTLGDDSPIDAGLLRKGLVVLDAVYRPGGTRLIREVGLVGARAIPGTEMLLHQGALQFKLFTGREAALDVMRSALESEADK